MAVKQLDISALNIRECVMEESFAVEERNSYECEYEYSGEPHRSTGFMIELLLEGSVTRYVDFEKYTATAPAILITSPEQVHQHVLSDDYRTISVYFKQDFLATETSDMLSYMECTLRSSLISVTYEQLEEVLPLARLLMQEQQAERLHKNNIIRNLLNAFIISCSRMQRICIDLFIADASHQRIVTRFKTLVQRNFREMIQVAQYADMLHVTPGHLNDMVKNTLGRSAKQIIDGARMMEAKRMLFWGEHPIKQICWELNFEDDAYFNRFFKKHSGVTPLEFQKNIRKKYNLSRDLVNRAS